ncbi:hypothetical protein CPB86DRAFT_780717 [Serendipita vermifera]|nr:hypothetical protein CPB86DRAFT_780717 [Serendipita vermifera]
MIPLPKEIPTFKDLFNVNSFYFIAFSWLLGQSIWQSFFGGVIAHKSLTRQTFGVLQGRLFPVYFSISATLSSILLVIWSNANKGLFQVRYFEFGHPVVQQTWNLVGLLALSVLNWFWIGPATNRISHQRQRLERAEGKPYYDKGVSNEMKKLNSQFGTMHGISSLANLVVILQLLWHGMWIANYGPYTQFREPGSVIIY